ncbi:DUF1772 domain-containing protein [Fulvivirga sp. 29W222]|uniref:DUF1772 domain-containing protein n=1 Tax=Fulvivirga marina TaxID=2494733 RepID=A0A937KC08_9BACT|nr:DUF1772 domain-containing protein [Fulvivirga marina]MBL6444723.1 DUF1772 domain-containing protein [Fulvivirga marina]
MYKILMTVTIMLLGLIAGLFYSYSCSVNTGLGRLTDSDYLKAMQSINKIILNPWFFIIFIGTLFLLPLATWLSYERAGTDQRFYLLLAASIVYAIGVFGVTGMGNVPLNEALARFNIETASLQEIHVHRSAFEVPWNKLNLIRTCANLLSLLLALMAVIKS